MGDSSRRLIRTIVVLVVVAMLSLLVAFLTSSLPLVYLSIVCSFLAMVTLILFSRRRKRRAT